MTAVHQLVSGAEAGATIGTHTHLLRRALRAAGWRSEVFVDRLGPGAERGDVVVVRWVGGDRPSGLAEAAGRGPVVVDYHRAGLELPPDRPPADLPPAVPAIAHGATGRRQLEAAGCAPVALLPALFDLSPVAPDVRVAHRMGTGDWLFVGPITPALAQHQLVKALWAYRRLVDPAARLHLVGPAMSATYLRSLRSFAQDLGLAAAVVLGGDVSPRGLAAHFQQAGVYVSLAPHGELTAPMVAAMGQGLAVVALGAAVMLEPVGETGLDPASTQPMAVALAVQRVLGDDQLRRRLVAAGRRAVVALEGAGRRSVETIADLARVAVPAR